MGVCVDTSWTWVDCSCSYIVDTMKDGMTAVENPPPTFIDLFRPIPMMLRTFNLFLQWFSVTMTFYGLSFASATLTLAGDPYINFTINVLVELPAFPIAIYLVNRFGRKPMLISTQLIAGVCVLIAGNLVILKVQCVTQTNIRIIAQ